MNVTKERKAENNLKIVGENIKPSPPARAVEINAALELFRIRSSQTVQMEDLSIRKSKQSGELEIELKKLSIEERKIDYDLFKFFIKVIVGITLLICGMIVFFILIKTGNFVLALSVLNFKELSPMIQILIGVFTGGGALGVGGTAAYKYLLKKNGKQNNGEEK